MREAETQSDKLSNLILQILHTNETMLLRLRNLEAGHDPHKSQQAQHQQTPLEETTTTCPTGAVDEVQRHEEVQTGITGSAFGFTFEEDLQGSRVYKRVLSDRSQSASVLPAQLTTAFSVNSALSLADVSNFSVFAFRFMRPRSRIVLRTDLEMQEQHPLLS